jgi:hypothetical protein
MFKKKSTRIVAFIGTLGASAALIGTAATNTGAYFTDSETGHVSGSSGHLALDKNSDYELSFAKLVPGEYKTQSVGYKTSGDTAEDIWLAFPDGVAYAKFSGAKHGANWDDGGMGRYGHFAVANSGGTVFSSYNLQDEADGSSGCADINGHGSGRQSTGVGDTPPLCGVPHYILLEQNVPSGTQAQFTMTFGVTGRQTDQGQAAPPAKVPFQVVGTQHGVRPDAANY